MKLYKLPFVMHQPSEETEWEYMAEIPLLPGCRAWGHTAAEALENLQGVAAAFIESFKDRGDALPAEIQEISLESDESAIPSEVYVAL